MNAREAPLYEPTTRDLQKIKREYGTLVKKIDTAFDVKSKTGANYMKKKQSRNSFRTALQSSLTAKLGEYGLDRSSQSPQANQTKSKFFKTNVANGF